MNCNQARAHWDLFYDSEGDAQLHLEINEHLSMCPDCARWFYRQNQLEEAIVEKLARQEPNAELWNSIQNACAASSPAPKRSWPYLGGMLVLAAAALLAAVGLSWYLFGGGSDNSRDLATLSVSLHEDLATGREAVKLSSRSNTEIEKYLRAKVPFPVRCPPRDDAGFQVEGGGVCKFDDAPVAYVVGQVDRRRVSVFILSIESLASFPAHADALRRRATLTDRQGELDIVIGRLDRNLVLVVGRNGPERLLKVFSAYGSYHDHSGVPPQPS